MKHSSVMTRRIEETVRGFCRTIMKIHRTKFLSDVETLRETVTITLLIRDERTVIYSGARKAERRLPEFDNPRILKAKLIM